MLFVQNVRRDRDAWQPGPLPAWSPVLKFLVLGFAVGGLVGFALGWRQ